MVQGAATHISFEHLHRGTTVSAILAANERGRLMRTFRWVGAVGALIYVAGFILVSSTPGGGDVDAADFEEFYVTDDNTALTLIGLFALTIGALGLLWCFYLLRTAIATTDAGFGWGAAALGLALVVGGAGILTGPSGVQAFTDTEFVGQPVAHALAQSGFAVMLVPGSLFLAAGVAALSFAGRKTGVLAAWVAIVGIVAAVVQLVAFIWIPAFAIPLWVLIASVVGLGATDRSYHPDDTSIS